MGRCLTYIGTEGTDRWPVATVLLVGGRTTAHRSPKIETVPSAATWAIVGRSWDHSFRFASSGLPRGGKQGRINGRILVSGLLRF